MQLNARKTKNPSKKWAKRLNRHVPRKTCRWLTNTWKDTQHHSLLEKCKTKVQWEITSHQSVWPKSKSLQTINVGKGVDKREDSCFVGGNVNWYNHYGRKYSVQFSRSVLSDSLWPHEPQHTRLPCPLATPKSTQTHFHLVGDAIQPSHPLSSPSPPALNLSQHQGLFKWVSSSHQVAKVLEFQLQNHSFQWIPTTDLLQNGLVGSPCSPRDSQESSPTRQYKSINSSVWAPKWETLKKEGLALRFRAKMAPGRRDEGWPKLFVKTFDWCSWFPCRWTAGDHHRLLLQWSTCWLDL